MVMFVAAVANVAFSEDRCLGTYTVRDECVGGACSSFEADVGKGDVFFEGSVHGSAESVFNDVMLFETFVICNLGIPVWSS